MSESDIVLRVYFVRHGETNENKMGITQGQMDTVLNRFGHLEAAKCGKALENVAFTRAFSSDLKRAMQTAEAIMVHHPNIHTQKDELLRNRYKGEYQGMGSDSPYENIWESVEPMESSVVFKARLMNWWKYNVELQAALLKSGSDPENILAVSHSACINKLFNTLSKKGRIEKPPGFVKKPCYNGSITTIEIRKDGSEEDSTDASSSEYYIDEGDLFQIEVDW